MLKEQFKKKICFVGPPPSDVTSKSFVIAILPFEDVDEEEIKYFCFIDSLQHCLKFLLIYKCFLKQIMFKIKKLFIIII